MPRVRPALLVAVALWVCSIAWIAWGNENAAIHRELLAAAITATLIAVSRWQRAELREAMRLTYRAATCADPSRNGAAMAAARTGEPERGTARS